MRALVDKNLCIGCGLCESACPDVFEMKENIAIVKCDPIPAEDKEYAEQAAADCPTTAIKIEK